MRRQQGVGVIYTTYYFKCIVPPWPWDILAWLKFCLRHTLASWSLLASTLPFTVSGRLLLQCAKKNPNTTSGSVTGYNLRSSVFKSEAQHAFYTFAILLPVLHKKGPWGKSRSAEMSNINRTPGNGTIPLAEVAPKTVPGECCGWSTVIKGLFIKRVVAEKCFKLNFLMCHRQYLIRLQFIASLAENLKEQQFQNLDKKKPKKKPILSAVLDINTGASYDPF